MTHEYSAWADDELQKILLKLAPNEREAFLEGIIHSTPKILKDMGIERDMEDPTVAVQNYWGLLIDLRQLNRTLNGISHEVSNILSKYKVANDSIGELETRFEFVSKRLKNIIVVLAQEFEDDYGAGSFDKYLEELFKDIDEPDDTEREDWQPRDGT